MSRDSQNQFWHYSKIYHAFYTFLCKNKAKQKQKQKQKQEQEQEQE